MILLTVCRAIVPVIYSEQFVTFNAFCRQDMVLHF
jgi:hypothetical protein